MKRIASWLAELFLLIGLRLAYWVEDGVGEADEYRVGGTSSDD